MRKSDFERFGPAQVDGTAFVIAQKDANTIINGAKIDPKSLGHSFEADRSFFLGEELVRIDISNPREFGLRLPTGNEAGANPFWLPGGQLPTGISEAVIDLRWTAPINIGISNIGTFE